MTEYWNAACERMDRQSLIDLQVRKLRRLCERADQTPFYRGLFGREGFEPSSLRSLTDLTRIPFTTRDEIMTAQTEGQPLFFGQPIMRLHTTSGTTGREPLKVVDSDIDWAWVADMWSCGLWAMGVRPGDIVFNAFGYGTFIGFWGLHYGAERLGATVIPGGAQTTDIRIKTIVSSGATVVASTPTYAFRLAQEADALGLDLHQSPVRLVVVSGEPGGLVPATKHALESEWRAQVCDVAGMSELGTIMSFECRHGSGGLHIIEDHFLEEVIDVRTLEPVPYGTRGERVVTSFGRRSYPLIRYRTGDLVERRPSPSCCGRTYDVYHGGILGRVDDMKLIRGTNVYARSIDAIVREFRSVVEYQVEIRTVNRRDEIRLFIEVDNNSEFGPLADNLRSALAEGHEGLRFEIDYAAPDTLPRYELKARRVTDYRVSESSPNEVLANA